MWCQSRYRLQAAEAQLKCRLFSNPVQCSGKVGGTEFMLIKLPDFKYTVSTAAIHYSSVELAGNCSHVGLGSKGTLSPF